MTQLANYTGLDIKVYIQDSLAQIHAQTAQGLEVMLPPLPAGIYEVSVFINGISIFSRG